MIITIGGDVSIKDSKELFASCNSKALFNDIIDIFKASSRVMINLECAVTEADTPIKKIGPNLKAPLNTIKALKEAGVTDCCLSNNHIFDYGKQGVRDTLAELKKYEINHTGFGKNEHDARKNMIITDGNIKVAVIAVCEHEYTYALKNRMGARAYDPYDTNDDIMQAKKDADHLIVIYHGGAEQSKYPSPRLLKACRSMIKHGADVVLCQHSHCIGCYEKFENGHILYGQGNFHFVCKKYEEQDGSWNTGLLAKITIDNSLELELIPCVVDGLGIRLANAQESNKILTELNQRSKTLDSDEWYENWRSFATSKERYKIVPNELYEEVSHFIDCESHTDVCKEIYQTYNQTNELE